MTSWVVAAVRRLLQAEGASGGPWGAARAGPTLRTSGTTRCLRPGCHHRAPRTSGYTQKELTFPHAETRPPPMAILGMPLAHREHLTGPARLSGTREHDKPFLSIISIAVLGWWSLRHPGGASSPIHDTREGDIDETSPVAPAPPHHEKCVSVRVPGLASLRPPRKPAASLHADPPAAGRPGTEGTEATELAPGKCPANGVAGHL